MPDIRAFIAIELPPVVQGILNKVIAELKTPQTKVVHWVPAHKIHLTLKFLGEIPPSQLEKVSQMLKTEIPLHPFFDLHISGLGAFPDMHRPRVVWTGVQAPPELAELQHAVELGTNQLGFTPEDKPFSPHLTLGRIDRFARSDDLRSASSFLARQSVGDLAVVTILDVCLFRSDLRPTGAEYTRLLSVPLSAQS